MLESQAKAKKGLPGKFFKKIKKMKVGFATKQCSVCVCNFANGVKFSWVFLKIDVFLGDIIRKLPCNHIYHEDCLKPWLKKHTECPLCRLDLLEYFSKNWALYLFIIHYRNLLVHLSLNNMIWPFIIFNVIHPLIRRKLFVF